MGLPRATLAWGGPIATFRLSRLASRGFCPNCGGTVFIQYDCYPDKTHVAAALVTDTIVELPQVGCHIFVASKPAWYQIAEDGAPRWNDWDPEFVALFPDVIERWVADQQHGAT